MTTIHDEEKIREIIHKAHNSEQDVIIMGNLMQEYAEYIRQKTIDKCIACVPLNVDYDTDKYEYDRMAGPIFVGPYESPIEIESNDGVRVYNETKNMFRKKTITNLEQLKK